MEKTNPIIEELQALTRLGFVGKQKAYFERMFADAKPVRCVSVREVFTLDEILRIKTIINPKQGHCYRNAVLLADLFPERVSYVEGFGYVDYWKIEHAFNRVGEKYIDITWEMALKMDVTEVPYVTLIEATRDEVIQDVQAHGNVTGDYYLHQYLKSL